MAANKKTKTKTKQNKTKHYLTLNVKTKQNKTKKQKQKNKNKNKNKKTKKKTMLFATHQKLGRSNERLQVYIKNDLFGIWLDPSLLTWSANTDKLVSKVNKHVGLLIRVRNVLPQRTLNLLYKSLIVPHFDYCDVVCGDACKTKCCWQNHFWPSS